MRLTALVLAWLTLCPACRGDDQPPPPAPAVATTTARPVTPPAPTPTPPARAADATPTDTAAPPLTGEGWWRDAVFYEIFVRSFHDTDADGIGDLRGVIAKLDYLETLGVNALWLMPIHPSPSYHGYDVTDYRDVNPDYGTLADFDALLAAARERGIRVIIDLVLNHSSSRHPWFLDSRRGADAPKRGWYSWRDTRPEGWQRPWDGAPVWHSLGDDWFYAIFWSGMPDLNLANPEVAEEMLDVMRFWLKRGVDGFRVDAARYLIEAADGRNADLDASKAFIREARQALRGIDADALFVAEAWTGVEDVAPYYGEGGEVYQLAFAFDIAGALLMAARGGSRSELNQAMMMSDKAHADRGFEAPFLTNHDMHRAMRKLGGDRARARIAAALLFAMPGTPFVYYGEEIGMQGLEGHEDEKKRTPMRWTASEPWHGFTSAAKPWFEATEHEGVDVESQLADGGSLLRHYQRLISLRRQHVALRRGETTRPRLAGGGAGAFAVLRSHPRQRIIVLYNLGDEPLAATTIEVAGVPRVLYAEGLSGEVVGTASGLRVPALAPRAFAFIALQGSEPR